MKHSEISAFTHQELNLLQYCNLSTDKFTLLEKSWNKEILLSPNVQQKLIELCQPFTSEYNKLYPETNFIKNLLEDPYTFSRTLLTLSKLGKEWYPYLKPLFDHLVNWFSQLF